MDGESDAKDHDNSWSNYTPTPEVPVGSSRIPHHPRRKVESVVSMHTSMKHGRRFLFSGGSAGRSRRRENEPEHACRRPGANARRQNFRAPGSGGCAAGKGATDQWRGVLPPPLGAPPECDQPPAHRRKHTRLSDMAADAEGEGHGPRWLVGAEARRSVGRFEIVRLLRRGVGHGNARCALGRRRLYPKARLFDAPLRA